MAKNSEILEGIENIREFWDPQMSKETFYKIIRPQLEPILFERKYIYRKKYKPEDERPKKYYTYKTLLLSLKLKIEKNTIFKNS